MKNDQVEQLSSTVGKQSRNLDQSQFFLNAMAHKCQLFFPWQNSREVIAEQLWKNHRIAQAGIVHSDLSLEEVEKLVERDWNMMPEAERQRIWEWGEGVEEVEAECGRLEEAIQSHMRALSEAE